MEIFLAGEYFYDTKNRGFVPLLIYVSRFILLIL